MSTSWTIDTTHSEISFSVRHMMFTKVRGRFDSWSAEFNYDARDLRESSVEVTIDATSINTRNEQRDGHLRSPDFFDTANFPTITFKSTRVEALDNRRFNLIGDLTIHGETHEVTLEAALVGDGIDPWGNLRAGFSAKTDILRKAFGLTWNQALEAGGVLVGDKVTIELDVQAIGKTVELPEAADKQVTASL
jgi:polyisoprenoid-binding protein YceI